MTRVPSADRLYVRLRDKLIDNDLVDKNINGERLSFVAQNIHDWLVTDHGKVEKIFISKQFCLNGRFNLVWNSGKITRHIINFMTYSIETL